jgi:putative SOS response-associated peptidase YedK
MTRPVCFSAVYENIMCNLYSITTSQQAMRALFKVQPDRDRAGNLAAMTGVFADYRAPVIRKDGDGERAIEMMRWGIPGPTQFGGKPVTNVRNASSSHWHPWLKPEYRCLVLASAFSEYTDSLPKVCHWFARDEARTPFAFAGIWRPWTGVRGTKANPMTGEHMLFSFLTTEPNDIVGPIHAKAMPVILTEADWDIWMDGDIEPALALQRPALNDLMRIVSIGPRQDPPTPAAETPKLHEGLLL